MRHMKQKRVVHKHLHGLALKPGSHKARQILKVGRVKR